VVSTRATPGVGAGALPVKGWDWSAFRGSAEALKYNRRDLAVLDRCVGRTTQRRIALQAGGNLGIFPKRLAATFETVYTFEPAPDLFAAMMHNAPEPNIVRFQAALGNTRSLVGLSRKRRDGRPNNHEGITHISGSGVIPTLQIDDLGLPCCDFLQLDLEGWELYALLGGVETIRRCRPVLVVEINKNQGFVGIETDYVRDVVKGMGYRFIERLSSDELYLPVP
jgi:FkbM family methyltransferase